MPNRSTRDEMQDTDASGNQVGARRTVAPPTRSAFDKEPGAGAPVASAAAPPAAKAPATAPPKGTYPGVLGAADLLKNRGRQIDQQAADEGG